MKYKTLALAYLSASALDNTRGLALALVLGLFGVNVNAVLADQVRIPVEENVRQGQQQTLPKKGELKAAVMARFGEPQRQTRPVGTPPISQWHYDRFVVYFEHDHVVHSAAKR